MKIQIDDKLVYELNDIKKKVIKNDILEDFFAEDMERRVRWIIEEKYEKCFERLLKDWESKLRERVSSIPTNKDELAQLIFSQPDYKNRSQREQETQI